MRILKGHADPVQRLLFSPTGTHLLSFGGFGQREVILWEVATGDILWKPDDFVGQPVFTPD